MTTYFGKRMYIKRKNNYNVIKAIKKAKEEIWNIWNEHNLDDELNKLIAKGKKIGRHSKGNELIENNTVIMEVWEYTINPKIKDKILYRITVSIENY